MSREDLMRDYVPVAERIGAFYSKHPDGSLQSELLELSETRVVIRGLAYRNADDPRPGIGLASMSIPGTTSFTRGSEVENTETSAWGRAIAALGFEVKRGIATQEDVASRQEQPAQQGLPPGYPGGDDFAAFLAAQEASQQATSAALPHPEDVIDEQGRTPLDRASAEPLPADKPKRTRAPRTPKEPAPVAEQVAAAVEQPIALASDGKKALARARQHVVGLSDEQFKAMSGFLTHKASSTEWTDADADIVIEGLANEGLTAIFKQGVFDTAATA